MEKKAKFSERLRELLELNNIRPSYLAKQLGISKALLSRYLNDDITPRQDKFDQIAQFFGVSYGWLLGYDTPKYDYRYEKECIKAKLDSIYNKEKLDLINSYIDFINKE